MVRRRDGERERGNKKDDEEKRIDRPADRAASQGNQQGDMPTPLNINASSCRSAVCIVHRGGSTHCLGVYLSSPLSPSPLLLRAISFSLVAQCWLRRVP